MSIGKITKFEFRIDLKRMAQLECYRNEFLKSKILKLTKTTSRFNFNKLVSLPPIDHIHFEHPPSSDIR